MSDSIRISLKHGLNPCIPICPFCGKERNEIRLLGRLPKDAKAPMNAVFDYTPCDECQENWQKGVPLIRVTTKSPWGEDAVPWVEQNGVKLYPTGSYSVVTKEAAKRLFDIDREVGSPILIDEKPYDEFIKSAKKQGVLDEKGAVPSDENN